MNQHLDAPADLEPARGVRLQPDPGVLMRRVVLKPARGIRLQPDRGVLMRRVVTSFILTPFVLTLLTSTLLFGQNAQQNAADAERVIKALEIRGGSVVGEIGAGDGALTLAIGKAVGPTGRVFSNEFNRDRLADISKAAQQAGLTNVTAIEGRETSTNFPDQCCDAIFMRNVYHHFGDPGAMNASLLESLKPGGSLAVQDFGPPPGGESATPSGRSRDGHHGVTPATVERELEAAGFEIVSSASWGDRVFMVVARRPVVECPQDTASGRGPRTVPGSDPSLP
jgi:SAM-dependent methyltransferase